MSKPVKVSIPETIEAATSVLEGIESLLTAKGWERAAIVYAFTTTEDKGGGSPESRKHRPKTRTVLGIREFAARGIKGLTTSDSVMTYRKHWIEGGGDPDIGPGDKVTLPEDDFPPTRTGTDGYESEAGLTKTIGKAVEKHGADKVAEVLTKAEPVAVGKAAAQDNEALGAVVEATTPEKLPAQSRARLEQTKENIDLMFFPMTLASLMGILREVEEGFGAYARQMPADAQGFIEVLEALVSSLKVSQAAAVGIEEAEAFLGGER